MKTSVKNFGLAVGP